MDYVIAMKALEALVENKGKSISKYTHHISLETKEMLKN